MTLTRVKLITQINTKIGLTKSDAHQIVDLFFKSICQNLEEGKEVKISGFGNFYTLDKNERPGRNPKTGESVMISKRRVVSFRQGQKLKKTINRNLKNFKE